MADGALIDRLDRTIDALLARRDATSALSDPELAALARVAAELRHHPSAAFKERLRAQLERRTSMAQALMAREVREGFTTITPYIRVRDAGLFEFLTKVFDAVETSSTKGPVGIHREVRVGDSMLMLGESAADTATPFSPAAFHIYVPDVDATYERAIAAGAESMGAPEDRPYGERAGFVKDAYGNHWYIATHLGASYMQQGLRTVTPFIHPRGVPAYIEFLTRALGAVEEFRHESPEGIVMHARLRIGNAAIEMGDTQGTSETMRTAFYLYVGDADALYAQAVAAGATPLSPPTDQWYGDRVASIEDTMGIRWYIARPA